MDISKTGHKPKKLKILQSAVLQFIATTDCPTAQKAANNYGISLRTAKRIFAFLQANGNIARTGNNRSGEYIVLKTEDITYE